MQVDKSASLSTASGEVSRRGAVEAAAIRTSAREANLYSATEADTVQTSQSDLVKMVLELQDKKAELRVAQLQQEYESGRYTVAAHEIATAILQGVLSGY